MFDRVDSKESLCTDIYEEEIDKALKKLKRFREVWLKASLSSNKELFRYADDDFYFYRFAIDREERSRIPLLDNIIYRMLVRYNIDFDPNSSSFDFIINDSSERVGYTLEDFYEDDDINGILQANEVCRSYIIRTVKGKKNAHIKCNNEHYKSENIKIEEITIQTFFNRYFPPEEYDEFARCISGYITQVKNIIGYQSIKVLSAMNLSAQKLFEEKVLIDWDYENTRYQIIDKNNEKIQNFLYVSDYDFKATWSEIRENYIENGLYKTMVGSETYAESFITSEWLYYSLKGKENFDYTAIVSGYLKSIEQLLYKLVMLNIDNNCVISLKRDNETKQKVVNNCIIVYEIRNHKKRL